ncbi:MAG: hypothetical protein KAJ58_01370 [Candidatus Pacebacteria bacterium]|nr:hypothetical protein [Candidatus Paceibacterota bacterium]
MSYLYDDIESGLLRFREKVFPQKLVEVALEWTTEAKGTWVDLHVRKCSKGQFGIGFKYIKPKEESSEEFVERITDSLKRQFGNDFIGHDISHETWMIKQRDYKVPH